ncbi:MAG: DUF3109 family protein [Flavobacteriales bacterium]
MIQIDDKILSPELFKKKFVCDLNACKGACCVEGDAGAPVTSAEVAIMEEGLEKVKPYMRPEGIAEIEKQGVFTVDVDGEYVTPLVKGKECAYVIFDENGITKCAWERAHSEGKVTFKKPTSCHLYPIRVDKSRGAEVLHYSEWNICKPACACGEKLDVQVFRFLKEPIIRQYGKSFYEALETADREMKKNGII